MGWSNGTEIAIDMIKSIRKHVKEEVKKADLYLDLFRILERADWDCINEAEGYDPIADMVIKKITGEYDNGECEDGID